MGEAALCLAQCMKILSFSRSKARKHVSPINVKVRIAWTFYIPYVARLWWRRYVLIASVEHALIPSWNASVACRAWKIKHVGNARRRFDRGNSKELKNIFHRNMVHRERRITWRENERMKLWNEIGMQMCENCKFVLFEVLWWMCRHNFLFFFFLILLAE